MGSKYGTCAKSTYVREVVSLKEAGRHADGGGLYLRIAPSGARSWGFMYAIDGKRTELGLGSVASIPLATARRLAREMREAVAVGTDPRIVLAPLTPPEAKKVTTFADFTDTYISSVKRAGRMKSIENSGGAAFAIML